MNVKGGRPAEAGRPLQMQHQDWVRRNFDARASWGASLGTGTAGSEDESLPLCGSDSQAAPLPWL